MFIPAITQRNPPSQENQDLPGQYWNEIQTIANDEKGTVVRFEQLYVYDLHSKIFSACSYCCVEVCSQMRMSK